ncbi:MAG: hypothetical protein ACYSSP_06765 [Planctomycetota bacterium]
MCDEKDKCQKPESPEEKPEECSPEKIEECHGEAEEHPCTEETAQEEQKGQEGTD